MARTRRWIAIPGLFLLLGLASCNTTDALTPQVDIPNAGPSVSNPVTQEDLNRMASAPQPMVGAALQSDQPISGTTLQPPSATAEQGLGAPPTTLEAQAQQLQQSGAVPVQPQQQAETLAPPVAAQTQAQQPALMSQAGVSIRFLPIIGAPVEAVTPLSKQLGIEARARGMTIKSASDANADHILKGYFSAFSDAKSTTVVYVWDVLDASGARLHRIQGQGTIPVAGADPWKVVPANMMIQIATKTMDEYQRWRLANPN
jgi:hypothetical protein